MELIIVRHGETPWTISGQFTGVTELELTEHGRQEASAVAPLLSQLLEGREPRVFSSPRRRAVETAHLVLPGVDVEETELVAEYDYGSYESMTFEEITAARTGWEIWRDGCEGGETTDEVGARAHRFISRFALDSPGPVVVVTHGHLSRILAAVALGLDPACGGLFTSSTASVSMLVENQGKVRLGLWNATARSSGLVGGAS